MEHFYLYTLHKGKKVYIKKKLDSEMSSSKAYGGLTDWPRINMHSRYKTVKIV